MAPFLNNDAFKKLTKIFFKKGPEVCITVRFTQKRGSDKGEMGTVTKSRPREMGGNQVNKGE